MANEARLDAIYASTLQLADRLWLWRWRVGLLGAPVVVGTLAAIATFILRRFPNSGDEYAYVYQASTLTAGRLWNAAPPFSDAFTLNYIVFDGSRAFGSFPVGWPLALAGAMAAGVPVWLVNPLFGAATLALTWMLGTRLYGLRVGVLATLVIGVSPFFLFNGASYFSHTFCGVLVLGAACLASRPDRTPSWVPLGVGFLLGWAVLSRYLTGVICGVPIVLWLVSRGDSLTTSGHTAVWRRLALVAFGGLPWIAVLAWYNGMLSGTPWHLTTLPLTRDLWFRAGWYYRAFDMLATHLVRHLMWTPALLVALYVYYLRVAPRGLRRGWLEWMPVCMVVALFAFVERGGNQYGPRFHYEVFPFLVLFVVANVFHAPSLDGASRGHRRVVAMLMVSVAVMPVSIAIHGSRERHVVEERMDVYRTAELAGLQNAVVFLTDRVGTRRSIAAEDLTRNGLDTAGSVLYALHRSAAEDCAVAVALGRTPYTYSWIRERRTSSLMRLSCRPATA